jgi:PhnB protein
MSKLTPYLCCRDAGKALDFYRDAFGATELYRLPDPSGRVCHAEMAIGSALFYLADEFPDYGCTSPLGQNGSAVSLCLEVPNVDKTVAHAESAGATVVRPPADEFYGHRSATLLDPFGHRWMVSTEVERLSPNEIRQRFEAMCSAPESS